MAQWAQWARWAAPAVLVAAAASAGPAAATSGGARAVPQADDYPLPSWAVAVGSTSGSVGNAWVMPFLAEQVDRTLVTELRVTVTGPAGPVGSWVVAPEGGAQPRIEVRDLDNLRHYTASVQAFSEGVAVSPVATTPVVATPSVSFYAGTTTDADGSLLPVAAVLSGPAVRDVHVRARYLDAGINGEPVSLTIPAGQVVGYGEVPVLPSPASDAQRWRPVLVQGAVDDTEVSFGEPDFWGYALRGEQVGPPVTVAPAQAAEGSAAEPGVLTFTASVPSPLIDPLPLTVVDRSGAPRAQFVIRAGARSATFTVSEPGDDVPGPDRTVTYGLRSNAPALLPAVIVGTLTNDDGNGPALGLDLVDGGKGLQTGHAWPSRIDWRNDGLGAAREGVVSGTFSARSPVMRLAPSSGTCSVGPAAAGGARRWSCSLGTVPAGTSGSILVEWAAQRSGSLTHTVTFTAEGAEPISAAYPSVNVLGPACTVTGRVGPDTVTGTDADDLLCGPLTSAGGRDVFVPGGGDDVIVGEGILDYSGSPKRIVDTLTPEGLQVEGWGSDLLRLRSPSPTRLVASGLRGSAKNDSIRGPWTSIEAGAGNDTVVVVPDLLVNQHLDGGPGRDTLKVNDRAGAWSSASLQQAHGFEVLVDGPASAYLSGGDSADTIRGGKGDDVIDVIDGVGGNDIVDGEAGNDTCRADVGDKVTCETVIWQPVD